MMPLSPRCSERIARICLSGDVRGTIRYERFGRLKLATWIRGCFMRSIETISSRTRAVAVAVRATSGTSGNRRRRTASSRYSRPEIVAPFRDAVGFVDGDEADVPRLQRREHVLGHEAFRRQVEDLVPAAVEIPPAPAVLIRRAATN